LPPAITTALYNANNQQTKVGTKTLTYDLNGNLTKDGNGNITYTWDARDRMTATSASNSTFQYDPLGRRTKKVISGTTTRFHYDGVNPVQELDNAGNIVANLLTGLNIDEVFTRTASSTTRTLLGDALNSTLALADNAGTLQTTYTYEPFRTSSVTGQSNTNSYQYTAGKTTARGSTTTGRGTTVPLVSASSPRIPSGSEPVSTSMSTPPTARFDGPTPSVST
jgi:YD repeat-containing protein